MTAKKKFNFKAPLEVFAKSIVQPMMYLSVAGILLIVGIILTNKTICALVPVLGSGPFQLVGAVVYQSLMFIINNLSILFCVGIAGAMAKKNKGHASLIALMSFFLFLQANNIVLNATGSLADASGMLGLTGTGQATVMGIQVLLGVALPVCRCRCLDRYLGRPVLLELPQDRLFGLGPGRYDGVF